MKNLKNTKITFCPGPGAVIPQWFTYQKEYFGRGDLEYKRLKEKTLKWLKKISGQEEVIPVAGAGTTAAIVALNTFLSKKILIIKTGYYSDRWINYLKKVKFSNSIEEVSYKEFINKKKFKKGYDWILFVYVETASCTKFDIKKVKKLCSLNKSKLMVDATASIGLEPNHDLADVVFFSSCKGLFGPTGLGFVAYKKKIKLKESKDFLLDYKTHQKSMYTLGYNCMASLYAISKIHKKLKQKIVYSKKFLKKYATDYTNSPLIGVGLKKKIKNKNLSYTIFYQPRLNPGYDVIFFLGLIKLNYKKIKTILQKRIINNLN